ncbi:MAG: hypothetical protein AB1397_06345 [bacterium]
MSIAIVLMAVVGILLLIEIVNFFIKYKRMKEREDLVSCVIMLLFFIFWAISIVLMIKKL